MAEGLKQRNVFFSLALLWVALQVWLTRVRWVNNDEGAHLMDAWLTIIGLVPDVDFIGRQPLYTLLYSPVVWLGGDYRAARMIPVIATLLGAIVLRAIGRQCCAVTGDLAALLYLYSPTVLVNAHLVKTEPPVILLSCLSFWAYGQFVGQRKDYWLAVAGFGAGLGFYIRESALAVLLALLILTLLVARSRRGAIIVLVAWTGVVASALLIYSRWLPWKQMLLSDRLFPPAALLRVAGKLLGLFANPGGGLRASSQPWIQTVRQIADPALMNLALLGAVVLAVYSWWQANPDDRNKIKVPCCWLACIALLYAYHVSRHGFYQVYFLEFLPPLCLLAASGLRTRYGAVVIDRLVAIPVLLIIGLFAGQLFSSPDHTTALTGLVCATVLGGLVFRYRGRSVESGCLLGCVLAASVYTGARTGLAYHCPFSPTSVKQVASLLSERTQPDDEVLSGAVIWEFQARRRPFANWSHPLSLDSPAKKPELWSSLFVSQPPKAIVWDQTASELFVKFPEVTEALENDYRVEAEVDGIKIFLRDGPQRVHASPETTR
jgi:4-amino-4-deoxy-L-arabinose transferase-like glycosyltransferase